MMKQKRFIILRGKLVCLLLAFAFCLCVESCSSTYGYRRAIKKSQRARIKKQRRGTPCSCNHGMFFDGPSGDRFAERRLFMV